MSNATNQTETKNEPQSWTIAPDAGSIAATAPNVHSKQAREAFSLSNFQVILILLAVGACLMTATWFVAKDFAYVPISLWDICSSVLTPEVASPSPPSN